MTGWEPIAAHILKNILTEGRVLTAKDLAIFENLKNLLTKILDKNPRYCFDSNHTCTYRAHACFVLFMKGDKWNEDDVLQCPYRHNIASGGDNEA